MLSNSNLLGYTNGAKKNREKKSRRIERKFEEPRKGERAREGTSIHADLESSPSGKK